MSSRQIDGGLEETMQHTKSRYRFAGMLWVVAVIFFIVSEGVIVFAQVHRGRRGFWCLPFWYAPIMNTAPMLSAVEIYRRVASNGVDASSRDALLKWSFHLAYLTCVATSTTVFCYVDQLIGGF